MGADWTPGTVAKATVRGVPDIQVVRGPNGWFDLSKGRIPSLHHPDYSGNVTDVRPLVVLDFTPSPAHLPQLLRLLRDNFWPDLAGQIEAQTKPPRIPEPGLWGVVEAASTLGPREVREWVRHPGPSTCWRDAFGSSAIWDSLIDPVLIREGVES